METVVRYHGLESTSGVEMFLFLGAVHISSYVQAGPIDSRELGPDNSNVTYSLREVFMLIVHNN